MYLYLITKPIVVSFTYKKHKGREYLYFQAGREGTYYISPRDASNGANIDNIEKCLKYMEQRIVNDREIVERLISLLPREKRQAYSKLLE
jgi:hypothetical protein